MLFFNLKDHGIRFFMSYDDMDVTDTDMGKWLSENDIAYRVVSHSDFPLMGGRRINELQFFEAEDLIAFKLRWA